MQPPASIICGVWNSLRFFTAIAVGGVGGASFGGLIGGGIDALLGAPQWAVHARCAGWTLLVLVVISDAIFDHLNFVRQPAKSGVQRDRTPDPNETAASAVLDNSPADAVRGIAAVVVASFVGAFSGFILGGMFVGYLVLFYFFAAWSPFAPDGWWPVLPLPARDQVAVSLAVVVGVFIVCGSLFFVFADSISVGRTRFQPLGRGGKNR